MFYDQIFFYPKRSTYLKKFLRNFENDKTKKTYETLKRDFFDMNRINCVLDIGANIGYQSLFYNNFFLSNTKIVCFEPHPISYFFLEKNLSKFNNIILYNFALGNKEGKEIISIPEHESHEANNLGIARISKSFTNYLKAEIIVKKFDELKILNDDYQSIFIKIDVEGYEKNVLLGMKNFLKKKKNFFLEIEVNKNYHNYSELKYIIDFLFSLNFSFFILDNNKLVKLNKVEIFKFSLYRNVEIYCKKLFLKMINTIRNITIIAHVDHGKTTLIDSLMKQSGAFRENENIEERVMDSGELEKERGITILAKPTSINWKNSRINIIDTPGHRDFAAEVERVLHMADGALLLIDSAEGVMPQTKFVLSKALKQGLKPIVIINKLDKPDQRANEVLDETFDLFVSLDANEEQLDFPVLYASGRSGWASKEIDGRRENLQPLLNLIIDHVKPSTFDKTKPFAMLSTLLYADSFLGRSLVGRIAQGTAKANQQIKAINLEGKKVDEGRLTKIFRYEGTKRVPIEIGEAGDIVIIAGLEKANVADTICDLEIHEPINATPIDPPTMSIKNYSK